MPSNLLVYSSESEPEPENSTTPNNPIPPEIHACHKFWMNMLHLLEGEVTKDSLSSSVADQRRMRHGF